LGEVVPATSLKLVSVLKTSGGLGFRAIALAAILSFALTGCATLPADAPTEKVDYRACLITQDDAFGKATGLNELSEYGVKQAVVTYGVGFESASSSKAKYAADLKYLVKKKCDSIVVSGPDFGELVGASAVANPDINFLYVAPTLDSKNIDGSIGNLAVYAVDQYESGMVQGYVAASLSQLHRVGFYMQPELDDRGIQAGIRAGVRAFDLERGVTTDVSNIGFLTADYTSPDAVDVVVVPTNAIEPAAIPRVKNSKATIVALGGDLYENDVYKELRPQIFTSVTPAVAGRIMELIAADLEGEFIGGTLGSTTARYGNGGIKLTPEHEQTYPAGLLDDIQHFTLDFETKTR
jgi:basic membrane lipoprotein Med (substrate-binding protein (PBP1-ABC) superfamily)